MIEFTNRSVPIVAYFADGEDIYNDADRIYFNGETEKYVPFLSSGVIEGKTELELVEIKDRTKTIKSYNKNRTINRLRPEIVETKKIDVTSNDLTVGKTIKVLNLTDVPITIVDDQGIPKFYTPVRNVVLKEFYGKVVFIEFNNLNTEQYISQYGGIDNYLDILYDKFKNDFYSDRFKKSMEIFDIANKLNNQLKRAKLEPNSNTIKVVNITEIPYEVMEEVRQGEELYIREFKFVLSGCKISHASPNPYLSKETDFISAIISGGDLSTFRIYINDPNEVFTTRYMNVGDQVIEIPSMSDFSRPPGMYMSIVNKDNKVDYKTIPLEEIDDKNYIYKTKEDAINGMDAYKLKEHELNLKKMELENARIEKDLTKTNIRGTVDEKKLEAELIKLEINKELEELKKDLEEQRSILEREKMEWEREKNKMVTTKTAEDFRYDLIKAELEKERELMKMRMLAYGHEKTKDTETMKFQYDLQRANADTTLQTLKVVGGVAALGVAAFTLYKKLS